MPINTIARGLLILIVLLCGRLLADPPSFTPGQSIEVRQGDTWSAATMEQKEGRKFHVRYADGTEEWVTVDRIRLPEGTAAASATDQQISPDGPFTQINLAPNSLRPSRSPWPVDLTPTTRPLAAFTDLTPPVDPGLNQVRELILCPDTPGVVVAVGNDRDNDQTPLLLIDTNSGTCQARSLAVHDHRILSAADGGRLLLTRPNFRDLSLHIWEYRDGQYHLQQNFVFVRRGENVCPNWACLVNPTHLLLRANDDAYLINLSFKRQIAYLRCGEITVHCSGKLMITSIARNTVLLRSSDLSICEQLPSANSIAMDAAATLFAVGDSQSLQILKLPSKAEIGHISGLNCQGRNDLLNASSLMIGSVYYDLKTGIPVWNYQFGDGKSMLMPDGRMLFVITRNGDTTVSLAALPDDRALSTLHGASPDAFILSPGAHVAIAGDLGAFGNAAKARAILDECLRGAGHVPDDNAPHYKLTINTAAGPSDKFDAMESERMGPPVYREYNAPSTVSTIDLGCDGVSILHREIKFCAGAVIMRQNGESIEQALGDAAKPDVNRLKSLDIPGYIVKGSRTDKLVTLGSSTLTREGFVPDAK